MYQCIKAGIVIGEFYSLAAAQLVASICHTSIWFKGNSIFRVQ